jgi:hypothetical protein
MASGSGDEFFQRSATFRDQIWDIEHSSDMQTLRQEMPREHRLHLFEIGTFAVRIRPVGHAASAQSACQIAWRVN